MINPKELTSEKESETLQNQKKCSKNGRISIETRKMHYFLIKYRP